MKNFDVMNLQNGGIMAITAHDLDVAQAYKVYKLKKAIEAASKKIEESRQGLIKEAGIEDAAEFDKQNQEFRDKLSKNEELTEDEKKQMEENNGKMSKFQQLYVELMNEDASLDGVKTIPYDAWKKLQDENKAVEINGTKKDILNGYFENVLEGAFWSIPEGE